MKMHDICGESECQTSIAFALLRILRFLDRIISLEIADFLFGFLHRIAAVKHCWRAEDACASAAEENWLDEEGSDTQKSRKSNVPLFGMLIGMSTFICGAGTDNEDSIDRSNISTWSS